MIVFVDTAGFKALFDETDDFHDQAQRIWSYLKKNNAELITSNLVMAETATLFKYRAGNRALLKFKEHSFDNPFFTIRRTTQQDEAEAWIWFLKPWKKLSFVDSVTFAQLNRLGIKKVFTFDAHFKEAGFTMVQPES